MMQQFKLVVVDDKVESTNENSVCAGDNTLKTSISKGEYDNAVSDCLMAHHYLKDILNTKDTVRLALSNLKCDNPLHIVFC